MPYKIEHKGGYVEVSLSGDPCQYELLEVLRQLRQRDPRKETPDLWVVADETVFPVEWHQPIAATVKGLCRKDMVGARSAIVAPDRLHKAQLEMYRHQARHLPFELQIFTCRDEAGEWLIE